MTDFEGKPAPWLQFSDISVGDLGWRMGALEDYLGDWIDGFTSIPRVEREAVLRASCPIPNDWTALCVTLLARPSDEDDDLDEAYQFVSQLLRG
ncbi:hypothetical protein [Acanthopleuribacter pedis]|uniref:Uncharacterized protein n=1 Tax=Acanthopleuribacter pedis TaxID=442870 RepID=A0A8J7QE05_9BACT|nr:hypothetical protein [Acanthopleuribacter pedis]MBO1322099.1 hypothetical protein [Acanthopleuribacter pedis]